MIKNYFKIVLRSIWKNKWYSLLNIIGMAIGITALTWGFQTYRYSFSFDNFHKDRDHVYRALVYKDGGEGIKGVVPMPAVKLAQNEFPGITDAVRFDSRGLTVRYNQNDAFAENAHFADESFFKLFHFPLVKGNNNLADKNALLLTESAAKKYFGKEEAIGKTLVFYSGESYTLPLTVTGILKDIPLNSTMQFSMLTNFENLLKADGTKIAPDDWSWFLDAAYFKIPDKGVVASVETALKKYLPIQNKARQDWKVTAFEFITLRENAQKRNLDANSFVERPEDSATYGPFILAFLIFLSACLNFSNTTVSRAGTRLKEIGVRKVMGSTQNLLVVQMLLECAFIVLLAVMLSMLLTKLWFPVFNSMFSGIKITAEFLSDTRLQLLLLVLLITTTLLAGGYSSFYISRFNVTSIFRGSVKFGGTNMFSRVMLGLQLSIAIITVIAAVGFSRNATFQANYDYGYTINNTIGVTTGDSTSFIAYKNAMASVPSVTALAGTRQHIGFGTRSMVAEVEGIKKETNYLEVGKDYISTMQLQVTEGRAFNAELEGDYTNSILVNEKFAANYGWKDKEAIGRQLKIDSSTFTVVGVMKDFHLDVLFNPIEPVVFRLGKENRFQFLVMQAKMTDLEKVYSKANAEWKKLFPNKPFSGFYQNELKAEAFSVTKNIAVIFFWFSLISILLTATGLFALVSLTAQKKMKEISLRKVVGANASHILVLINRGYFWVFIVASVLGCYGGFALTKLLLDMIFGVNAGISGSTILLSLLAVFFIAAVTSGINVWKAVKSNPIKILRSE